MTTMRAMKMKNPTMLEIMAAIVDSDTGPVATAPSALLTLVFMLPVIEGWERVVS